ncbi:cytoplasmic trehalase [Salmonella enterica subsp. enterica]|uniref:Cytoplasmic trehalase n=1 Tax=Salmonella enterica I TaxID=59201 RepID=A0A447TT25_SALET|nr:cytoplasmic trehalase [Salmonella enterica subsp. enterica]
MSTLNRQPGNTRIFLRRKPEVLVIMLNQKLNPTPSEDLTIDVDLLYETDPCELKLDEMIEAEPEPEMIEGLPASDALTPADRYLELFEHVQSTKLFPDSKNVPGLRAEDGPA